MGKGQAYVALNLNWRYYEYIVTARTQARDLLWTYDSIRRLKDAQIKSQINDYNYVEPGILWWVFDREAALRRGGLEDATPAIPAAEPYENLNRKRSPDQAVLLIDEIDKADPDVPNNLLVPLGSLYFRVEETGTLVCRSRPIRGQKSHEKMSNLLVIITTNEERALPQAFLRRCIIHKLIHPNKERLVEIAKWHFKAAHSKPTAGDIALFESIAAKVEEFREQAGRMGIRPPSTAEFLDAVVACRKLGMKVGSPAWEVVEQVVLCKQSELRDQTRE